VEILFIFEISRMIRQIRPIILVSLITQQATQSGLRIFFTSRADFKEKRYFSRGKAVLYHLQSTAFLIEKYRFTALDLQTY